MPSRAIDHAFTTRNTVGAASDPTYAGALSFMRRKFSKDARDVDAVVWGIPFDAAVSNRPGARFGPQAIRRASAIFDNDPQYPFSRDLFENLSVIDYGDCLLDYGNHQKTPAAIEREAAKILRAGAFLLSLGGDHFVTWPLLKAHAAVHGPLALLHFDAHQDTWFDDGRRIDHGSFVARAVRDGIIDPDRSIQIGIRTHAPEDFGIRILHGWEVEDMRPADIAYAIAERTGGKKTYLTFDIDCLDPGLCARHRHARGGRPFLRQDPVGAEAARSCRHRRRRHRRGCAGLRSCRYHGNRRRHRGHVHPRPAGGAKGTDAGPGVGPGQRPAKRNAHMKPRIFIDGEHGTTGLQIRARLAGRDDLEVISIPESERRNKDLRAELLKESDLAILCLPDEAARESVALLEGHDRTRIIDTSTAHRVDPDWIYGFAEMARGQRDKIAAARQVANPGCYPTGAISLIRPLVEAGVLPDDYPVVISAVSGYPAAASR